MKNLSQYPDREFRAGDHICRQGKAANAMYILVSGSLAVIEDGVKIAVVDEPLSVVGEISYLLDRPRSADLKAETDCVLKVVEDVDRFFREDPEHGMEIARLLARRLQEMDEKFLEVRGLLKDAGGKVPGEDELPPELQPFRRYLKRLNV